MTSQELTNMLNDNRVISTLIIFVDTHDFILNQYINKIAKLRNKEPLYIEDLSTISSDSGSLFDSDIVDNYLYIYKVDKFQSSDKSLLSKDNLIIVTGKIEDSATASLFEDISVSYPKLDPIHIKDYVLSTNQDLDRNNLEWLCEICKNDIFRIQNELDKFSIFRKSERKKIFNDYVNDSLCSDLSLFTIFSFSDAIITKDIVKLNNILSEISCIDIEPVGLITVLYNNFKNIINIQLTPNATPESLNMNPKQFAAIRYRTGKYSSSQLINIFKMITSIDMKLKTGELPNDYIIDYMLIKILSA